MEKVLGIDLGTFNTCAAVVDGDMPIVIASRGGYKVTPSMVAVTETGKRLVGHLAKRQAVTNAEHTVYAAKRLIGQKWDSPHVQKASATYPYSLVAGSHGDVRVALRDRVHSIPEVSAMVLQEVKLAAEDFLGQSIRKAVVTVPAHFNDGQRQATKDAGTIAGLEVIRIINEPTAAALAYGFGKPVDRTIAIYDLGGGTFDISILEISSNGVFRVISTAGDTFLGGEDFDQRVVDWLIDGFITDHGIDLRQDRMALQRLRDAAEKARCELSSATTAEINLPFILTNEDNDPLHLQRVLSRDHLTELTGDLVQRTIDICASTLQSAGLRKLQIQDVVLVGGMTRMPRIQQAVSEFFDRPPCRGVHPEEVVGLGAAIQGAALQSRVSRMVLLDVTPHTLGIMLVGGHFEELIRKNTTVPTSHSKVFTTMRDQQTAVRILVMQGESPRATDNELLGEFILEGIRPAPAGEVEIEVTFRVSADGILSVDAKDLDTGKAQSITVRSGSGLTPDELQQLVDRAQEHTVTTRRDTSVEQARQRIELLLAEIDRLLSQIDQSHELATQLDPASTASTRALLDDVRQLIAVSDATTLLAQIDALDRTKSRLRSIIQPAAEPSAP